MQQKVIKLLIRKVFLPLFSATLVPSQNFTIIADCNQITNLGKVYFAQLKECKIEFCIHK